MDHRQQQLVAAAEALRTWVHAQKATWHAPFPVMAAPPLLHTVAPVAEASPLTTDAFLPDLAAPEMSSADEAGSAVPDAAGFGLPAVDLGAKVGGALSVLQRLAGQLVPAMTRHWKPAAAALAVVAMVGVARWSWPVMSRAMSTTLTSASERIKRPAPPVPEPVAVAAAPAARATPVRRTGTLHVESTPAGAHVLLDGKDRGVTPLTLTEVTAGGHAMLLTADGGSIRRSVSVVADKTTDVNEAIFSGWLHVSSSLELQVSEAGTGHVLDDRNQLLLSPGPHQLRFENRRLAFVDTRTVEIKPGETSSLNIEPPPSSLSVTASLPAEVLVDGTLVGGTPLTGFAIQLGTREITVRTAAGEKTSVVTVTVDPVVLDVRFD